MRYHEILVSVFPKFPYQFDDERITPGYSVSLFKIVLSTILIHILANVIKGNTFKEWCALIRNDVYVWGNHAKLHADHVPGVSTGTKMYLY